MYCHHSLFLTFMTSSVLLLVQMSRGVDSHFSLFLNETETRRLLGVPGELYYARNGYLNDYALSFNLLLKTDVTDIYFDFHNEQLPGLPDIKMYYSLTVTVSNLHAMYQPIASISPNGTVPNKPTSVQQSRPVSQHRQQLIDDIEPTSKIPGVEADHVTIDESSTSTVFYVGVGCAATVIVIIAGVTLLCYLMCGRAASKRNMSSPSNEKSLRNEEEEEPDSLLGEDNCKAVVMSCTRQGDVMTSCIRQGTLPRMPRDDPQAPPIYETCADDSLSIQFNQISLADIRVEPCRLSLKEVLYQGSYSCIYRGSMIAGTETTVLEDQDVLIKAIVLDTVDRCEVDEMLKEGSSLLGLQHENLNPIVTACLDHTQTPLLVYPYMTNGNLKLFLQRCRNNDDLLTIEQLMCIAIQLAGAIQYLHRRNIIHRDIATRNCLIDSCLSVRLTDAALSSDIFPRDYATIFENGRRLPVKWMSVEALEDGTYTTQADVWSFGVTVWELTTFATQPFASVDPADLSMHLRRGFRPTQPLYCPNELYSLLIESWQLCPSERPTIAQLQASLHNFCTLYSTKLR